VLFSTASLEILSRVTLTLNFTEIVEGLHFAPISIDH